MSVRRMLVLIFAGSVSVVWPQAATTSVSGSIAAESKGLPDAHVVLFPVAAPPPALMAAANAAPTAPPMAMSDKKGEITLPNVSPGVYQVCVMARQDDVLNPCEWTRPTPTIAVAVGKAAPNLALDLTRGTTLRFEIDDPDGLVPTAFQLHPDALFHPGVYSADGEFHMAAYVSSTKKKHTYELVIPLDTALRPWIEALGVQAVDEKGARADRVDAGVIRADKGKGPVKLSYRAVATK